MTMAVYWVVAPYSLVSEVPAVSIIRAMSPPTTISLTTSPHEWKRATPVE